jgi:hypothetical protein
MPEREMKLRCPKLTKVIYAWERDET